MKYQIKHDTDGLLFEPDDAGSLATQLQRLVDKPELVERLRRGIASVRTVDDEMGDLMQVYRAAQSSAGSRSEVRVS
jgi:hypothetical protein